jgi:tetratricopeptide (TPR) repeat protein
MSEPPGGAATGAALPRDASPFTGRAHELDRLVPEAAASGGVIGIYAIGGRAGVGTTALAVHAAHQLAGRFPDGQLFLPLHGHAAGHRPLAPAEALGRLLLAAGLDAARIPAGQRERAALWQDRLAGRRVLLVLDDAAGYEQVGPLLPGGGPCLALVTSRRRLAALADDATVSLDVLSAGQAAELLAAIAARPGLAPGNRALAQIAALCEFRPLALGMLGRRLHYRPAWSAAGLAAELAAARGQADLAGAEDEPVAAAFSLAYRGLAAGEQRMFGRLGLYPGTEVDARVGAALLDCDLAAAGQHLDGLRDQYLITETAPGQYRLHDLLRGYARALAAAEDPIEASAAVSRLLGDLEHTAATAAALLARHPRPDAAARYLPAAAPPDLAGRDHALAWLRAHRADLLACIGHAAGHGLRARLVGLTAGLAALLRVDGPWAEGLELCAAAVTAARQLGDRLGEAGARSDLAALCDRAGDHAAAAAELTRALRLYREAGSRDGEAAALAELGTARYLAGDAPGAAADLEQSLRLYLALGSRAGEAAALNELGHLRGWSGDRPAATRALARSAQLCRDLGDRHGEASAHGRLGALQVLGGDLADATTALAAARRLYRELGHPGGEAGALTGLAMVQRMTGRRGDEAAVLNRLGALRLQSGAPGEALACHRRALDLAREVRRPLEEARALEGAGRCALGTGRTAVAAVGFRQALRIYQRIGADEAAGLAAELGRLTGATVSS